MRKETFDFSEALRRMKEGKNVRRKNSEYIFAICGGGCFPQAISYRTCVSNMFSLGVAAIPTECILAFNTDVNVDEVYESYRFAKLKYLEVIKHQ